MPLDEWHFYGRGKEENIHKKSQKEQLRRHIQMFIGPQTSTERELSLNQVRMGHKAFKICFELAFNIEQTCFKLFLSKTTNQQIVDECVALLRAAVSFFSQSVPKAFNMDEIEENDLLSDICTDVSTVSTTFASVASLASEADTAERDAAIDDLLEWLEMQPSWGLLE